MHPTRRRYRRDLKFATERGELTTGKHPTAMEAGCLTLFVFYRRDELRTREGTAPRLHAGERRPRTGLGHHDRHLGLQSTRRSRSGFVRGEHRQSQTHHEYGAHDKRDDSPAQPRAISVSHVQLIPPNASFVDSSLACASVRQ